MEPTQKQPTQEELNELKRKRTQKIMLAGVGALCLIGIIVGVMDNRINVPGSDPVNKESETKTELILLKAEVTRFEIGGFGTVGILDVKFVNHDTRAYKDPVIEIKYYSNSGTLLNSTSKTVYEKFPAKKTRVIRRINVGFIPQQTTSCYAAVVTAIPQ